MTKKEIWHSVPNYEGLYEASNFGRVKSLGKTYVQHFKNKDTTYTSLPKILSLHYDKNGYLRCTLNKNGKGIMMPVHRIIGFTFLGIPEKNMQINHKNGIKDDNRIENLEWVTPKENTVHAHSTGLCGINGVSKQVACVNDNGQILRVFESARQASLWCGLKSGNCNIAKVCRQGYGHCSGYGWKYISLNEYLSFNYKL